jgi:hypothetical protein
MSQKIDNISTKFSAIESTHTELQESLNSVCKLSEVKILFDALLQHQQQLVHQQQLEASRQREQQELQMQLHQSLLKNQQVLLEQQQQQLAQQQLQLQQISFLQQSQTAFMTNQAAPLPSAPLMSSNGDD